MDYPLPIDAAGRTVLVVLCLACLRCGGSSWLGGSLRRRARPSAWLDEYARFGAGRASRRLALALARAIGGLGLAAVLALWVLYALARLADDFAASPARSAVGSALGAFLCRLAR